MSTFEPGQWYVMDRYASTMQAAYVAGPFATRAECEADRRARNIADDCESWQAPSDPPRANDLHSTVHGYTPLPARDDS